jgi:long-chain acyl-CoA synthetase
MSSKLFSYQLPNSITSPDYTPIYRSKGIKDGKLLDNLSDEVKTLWDNFWVACKKTPNRNCFGKRSINPNGQAGEFEWSSYAHAGQRIGHFGAGLHELQVLQKDAEGRFLLMGLMGRNAAEWCIAEIASLGFNACIIPLYTASVPETLTHVLNQNACAVITCDNDSAKVLIQTKPTIPTLKALIVYGGPVPNELLTQAEKSGLKIHMFHDVEELGKKKGTAAPWTPPKPEDAFSFCYTSGSSGMPKAVVITHKMQISNMAATNKFVVDCNINYPLPGGEQHISYLPMAHVMERSCISLCYFHSSAIGFFQGKRESLMEDIATLRPTWLPSVPRLLNTIVDKILAGVNNAGGNKAKTFHKALNAKIAGLQRGKLKHWLWDPLVFRRIAKKLGLDRCRLIITGSAPIAGKNLDFLRALISGFVVEGYGSTEMTCGATMTEARHFSSEHVGGPLPCVEIRLVSVKDMNYLATDTQHNGKPCMGRGEILVRGPTVMKEYYRSPEATAKAVDQDGWYHSGDVGVWLPDGTLKIVDRARNIYKLSIGEYIEPEKVENIITRAGLIAQCFVHGDAFHPSLVAIIVPDPEVALPWAKSKGLPANITMKELCTNADFEKAVMDDIVKTAKANSLASFQIPKKILLEPNMWTIADLLTPTFKTQRDKVKKHYETSLAEMLGPVA